MSISDPPTGPKWSASHTRKARERARHMRDVQRSAEALRTRRREEQQRDAAKDGRPVQAGTRAQPVPPMPAQHLRKPGIEAYMRLRPEYESPGYFGSGKLDGKVALITGGDSGIGRAVSVLFAREGADIAIVYLDEDEDAEETKRAVEAEGRRCLLLPGDVGDSTFCNDAVEFTVKHLDHLDILVNNAAFQQHQLSLEDITDEQLELTFRTNIFGYFYMARAALRHLPYGGVIVNTGSVTGDDGSSHLLDYAATKGAIHNFTRSLAQNLIGRGIRVNGVAPGPVWTPLNPADSDADDVRRFGADVPMKRPAQPEEIAPVFVFLAAPIDSGYITGEIVAIYGGQPT